MQITFPSNTTETIDEIRGAIGRNVSFYVLANTEICPNGCTLDPVTDTSTNSFCPVCSGNYYIYTYSGVSVSGHVFWNSSDLMQWPSAGFTFDGECRVQIKHTSTNLNMVDTCKYVVVDNKKMTIKSKAFRGVPNINRIILYLDQEERDDE
jgi:hypothetical protein